MRVDLCNEINSRTESQYHAQQENNISSGVRKCNPTHSVQMWTSNIKSTKHQSSLNVTLVAEQVTKQLGLI